MLWHHASIGGLPPTAESLLYNILKPFLFLGDRPWLEQATQYTPRRLGGLGLILPDAMFTAQSITFLAHHLISEDPYGAWLRYNLSLYLHHDHGCCPASLLLRGSAHHTRLTNISTRNSGFWGRLAHALASVDLTIDQTWVSVDTTALLTLPWLLPETVSALPATWPPTKVRSTMNRGWITWADVLWLLSSSTTGRFYPPSWPLGPPSPSASYTNHHPRPGMNLDTKGPGLGQMWSAFWRALPAGLRSRLLLAQHLPFAPSREPAGRLSSAATPLLPDAASLAFPWALLRVHGTRLGSCTTRATRLAQSPSAVIIPDWHSDPPVPPSAWTTVWKELHDVPLPSTAISDCYLFLQRRTWLAKGPVRLMLCPQQACTELESQPHSYVTCPEIMRLWTDSLVVLRALAVMDIVPLEPILIALGWQTVKASRLTDTGSSSGEQPSSTTSPPFAAPPSHATAKEVSFTSPSRPLPPLHPG